MSEDSTIRTNNRAVKAAKKVVTYLSYRKNCVHLQQFADFFESSEIIHYACEPEFLDLFCPLLERKRLKRPFLEYLLRFYQERRESGQYRGSLTYICDLLLEQRGKTRQPCIASVMFLFLFLLVFVMEILSEGFLGGDLSQSTIFFWLYGAVFSVVLTALLHKDYLQLYKEHTACGARLIVVFHIVLVLGAAALISVVSGGSSARIGEMSVLITVEVLGVFLALYAIAVLVVYGVWLISRWFISTH